MFIIYIIYLYFFSILNSDFSDGGPSKFGILALASKGTQSYSTRSSHWYFIIQIRRREKKRKYLERRFLKCKKNFSLTETTNCATQRPGEKNETSISGWLTGQVPKTRVFWSPLFIELFSAKKPGSFWSKSGLKL